jgi:AcrR family transcriptional regulator
MGRSSEGPRGRRAVQAEQTRQEILQAARRRFAAGGYAATSLKEIAADAGVSVQTLYDSVGSKADLVRRLNDLIDAEAGVGEIAATIPTESDPAAVARIPARVTRRILERCGDIIRASIDGARAEPHLAHVLEEGGQRHRAGARSVAARLSALDALAPGLDEAGAATSIAALADVRLAFVLIDDHGFGFDEVEDWIAAATARVVLR